MATLEEVRVGIATRLETIPGLQASAYMLANPTPPTAWVFPDEIQYDKTFGRGADDWFMKIQVFVGTPSDIGSQQRLDLMLAPSGEDSVKAVMEVDNTLGGVVSGLRVVDCSGYRVYPGEGGVQYLGAEWRVHVIE